MPRPPAHNGKDRRITIAVDEEMEQRIKEAAERESMPVSVLLRRIIIDWLRHR